MGIPSCLANIPILKCNGSDIALNDFENNYLKINQPVVITDVLDQLPCAKWSVKYLLDVVGENQVTVRGKTHLSQYKTGKAYTVKETSFSDYVHDLQQKNQSGLTSYMAVQNISKIFPELQKDAILPDFVGKVHNGPFLWVARKGHYEYCHYDPDASLLMMIEGQKHVRLFSCGDFKKLYPNSLGSKGKTIQSQIDCDSPNLDVYPEFSKAICYYATLDPGDMLLIPAFWWHQVSSLSDSVSMNVFFGDAGEASYITRIMEEPVWPAFRYWLLNVVEQNRNYPSFTRTLERLPVCVENLLLKHFHEVAPPCNLNKLLQTIMDYLNITSLPPFTGGGKHPPPLKIRGLRWR